MKRIKGHLDLIRDENGVVHNINISALEAAKAKKQKREEMENRLDRIEQILETIMSKLPKE